MSTTIPPNNNTGLYNTQGSTAPTVDGNIAVDNIVATGNVTVGGYVSAVGNIAGNYILGNGSQLTGLPATYTNANVVSLLAAFGSNTISTTGNISGGYFLGNGSLLSGLPETYSNANVAGFLPVYNGNIGANVVTANLFSGSGANLSSLTGANVTGQVANATYATNAGSANTANSATTAGSANTANSAVTAGTVTGNAQANITSVGTLTSLNVTGNITGGNLNTGGNVTGLFLKTSGVQGNIVGANYVSANYFVGDGSLLTNLPSSNVTLSGNLAGNLQGNGFGANAFAFVSATGNITGNYILGNGSQLTGLPATYSDANVVTLLATFGSNTVSTTGNVTAGYFAGNGSLLTNLTGANISGTVANATYATDSAHAVVSDSANAVSGSNVSGVVAQATQANYANIANSVSGSNVSGTVADATQANYANVANSVAGANVTGSVAQANIANTANSVAGANVSGQVANALVAGTVYTAAQPAITSVGTLTSLSATGNITGGNLQINNNANIVNDLTVGGTIFGTFAGNITGNLVVPGSNTQVIYNNNGNAAASANFTFNSDTNQLSVTGNVVGGNVSTTGNVSGAYISGNGSLLSSITGANITGTVANATYATNAGSATTATTADTANSVAGANVTGSVAQANYANIANSVAGGNVTGSVAQANYANIANSVAGSNVTGSVAQATYANIANSVSGSNVTGAVAQATVADTANAVAGGNVSGQVANALVAGTVYTNAQPNITSVGTLTSLSVTGNIATGGILTDGYYYANGAPFSSGGTYGNANVNTLLAAWGSNTLTTTGNVSAGNLAVTGANAQLVMSGSTSNKINFGTTGFGPPTVGTYSPGAKVVLYDSISNTNAGYAIGIDSYTMWFNTDIPGSNFEYYVGNAKVATIETDGRITANAVTYTGTDGTNGQVLTTYGNGVTYFSTVSGGSGSPGGSDSQIQYNDAGAFGGNVAMTFNDTTGNVTLGNIVTNTNKIQTVAAIDIANVTGFGTTTPFRITVGNAYLDGTANSIYTNIGAGTVASTMNAVRLLSADAISVPNTGTRYSQTNSTVWGIPSANISNANSRFTACRNETYIGGGANNFNWTATNTTTTTAVSNQVNVGRGTNANLAALGNTVVNGVTGLFSGATVNNYSTANVAYGVISQINGADAVGNVYGTVGNAIAYSAAMSTFLANTANTPTTTYVSYYHPSSNSANIPGGFGAAMGVMARNAPNYFAFRNDDDLAQTRLGMLSRFHELNANTSTTTGTVNIDKNSGQVQTIYPTGNVTIGTFSNFVTRQQRPNSVFVNAADTVTLVIQQGATPYTVTMPTGNTQIRYASGVSTVGATANSTTMISITGVYDYNTAANSYLITISPEFS